MSVPRDQVVRWEMSIVPYVRFDSLAVQKGFCRLEDQS